MHEVTINSSFPTIIDAAGNTWYRLNPANLSPEFNKQYEPTYLGTSYCLFFGDGSSKVGYSISPVEKIVGEIREITSCPVKDALVVLILPPHTNYQETRHALRQALKEKPSDGGNLFELSEELFLASVPYLPLLDERAAKALAAEKFTTMIKNIAMVGVENIKPGANLAEPVQEKDRRTQRGTSGKDPLWKNVISADQQTFRFGTDSMTAFVDKEGVLWCVGKHACTILGISKHKDVIGRLDDDEKGVSHIDTPGGRQEMLIVNEAGLYNLIFRSRSKEAKKFRRWVTHEVLPTIRKTGSYSLNSSRCSEGLTTTKLQEVGYASRNAAMLIKAHGALYNKSLARKLVNDLVLEATGYDVMQRLHDTGLLPSEYAGIMTAEEVVGDFINEVFDLQSDAATPFSEIYEIYKEWNQYRNGGQPVTRKRLGLILGERFNKVRRSNGIVYFGLARKVQEVTA